VVLALDLSGVAILAGWSPYPVFADGFDPWVDGDSMPVSDWARRLLPSRPAPDGAVDVRVDVSLERRPASCFAFRRSVIDVRVDVAGLVGRAIEAQLVAAALLRATELERLFDDDEDAVAWCQERFDGEDVGFHIVEVHAERCEHPKHSELVCATVGRLGYHLGTREFWHAETFVFDALSGQRLTREALLAPYDRYLLDELFGRIRSEVDVPHLTWVDVEVDFVPRAAGVDIVPTVDGLIWRWSPYTHLVGGIDVIVPWDVLDNVLAMP
jgi:hypothetical protein